MSQRKKWSGAQKFEIALLAARGETTLNEICQRYTVAPSQGSCLEEAATSCPFNFD